MDCTFWPLYDKNLDDSLHIFFFIYEPLTFQLDVSYHDDGGVEIAAVGHFTALAGLESEIEPIVSLHNTDERTLESINI